MQMNLSNLWQLESFCSGETKLTPIDYKTSIELSQKYLEYSKLNSITEKLAFYDQNRAIFEFPYNQFIVKVENTILFEFNFKPAPHFLETHIYNPWFIDRSIEYLTYTSSNITGIPFQSSSQLWENFIEIKDKLPILKKFIKQEKKKFRKLAEIIAPGRFEYWYNFKINDAKVLSNRGEWTKECWTELFVQEIVDYIIKLERYYLDTKVKYVTNMDSNNGLNNIGLYKSSPQLETTILKQLPKTPKPIVYPTILELFRNKKSKLDKFIEIMINHGLFNEHGKWETNNKTGEFLPIKKFLEDHSIIKKLSAPKLKHVLEKEFGEIMSERYFREKNHLFILENSLHMDLLDLKDR